MTSDTKFTGQVCDCDWQQSAHRALRKSIRRAVVVDLSVATNVHRFAYILFDFVGTAVYAHFYFLFQCKLSISGEVLANVGKWNINDNDADKQQHRFYSWWLIISHSAWLSLHWRWRMCVLACLYLYSQRNRTIQVCSEYNFAAYFWGLRLETDLRCSKLDVARNPPRTRHPNRLWRWSTAIKLERHRAFITIYMQTVKDKWAAADVEHSNLAQPNSTTKII